MAARTAVKSRVLACMHVPLPNVEAHITTYFRLGRWRVRSRSRPRGNGGSSTASALKPAQRYRLDDVIGALGEDQRRARPRRQDVLLEIGEIGALPDCGCGGDRFVVRQ